MMSRISTTINDTFINIPNTKRSPPRSKHKRDAFEFPPRQPNRNTSSVTHIVRATFQAELDLVTARFPHWNNSSRSSRFPSCSLAKSSLFFRLHPPPSREERRREERGRAAAHTEREAAAGNGQHGRALAVGGMGADLLPRNILQQYDFRKDVWALLPPMPTPRYDANTHLLDNKLYVAGGRQCKRPVKAFEMYDSDTRSWTSLAMLSCKRSYGGVLWDAAGRLCLLGGLRQGGGHQTSKFTNNVNIFDCNKGTWLKSDETVPLKTKRADFVAALLRGRMVVAGGLGHQPSALDTVEAFHPLKKKWEPLASMTFPRCSASSIVIRDRLLVVGGVNQVPSSAHEILYVKEEEYL